MIHAGAPTETPYYRPMGLAFAAHACLACGRHPDTHALATPDSDDACPLCGLGDEIEGPRATGCGHTGDPDGICSDCGWLPRT